MMDQEELQQMTQEIRTFEEELKRWKKEREQVEREIRHCEAEIEGRKIIAKMQGIIAEARITGEEVVTVMEVGIEDFKAGDDGKILAGTARVIWDYCEKKGYNPLLKEFPTEGVSYYHLNINL